MQLRRFLFEWEDLPWFPARVRGYMLDFLTFFLKLGKLYNPVLPLLLQKLREEKTEILFDLASGGAGPLESLLPALRKESPFLRVLLSDLYPNPEAWKRLEKAFPQTVSGVENPVDALALPDAEAAVFTMFSALHHFDSGMLRQLLCSLAARKSPALFCDGGGNRLALLGGLVVMPVLFVVATPFLRPFRVRRLLLTYLLPVVPFCTLWDGTVSVLRLYSFQALERLAASCSTPEYSWKARRFRKFPGVYVYCLEGRPKS